jgi:hypothetical protein
VDPGGLGQPRLEVVDFSAELDRWTIRPASVIVDLSD